MIVALWFAGCAPPRPVAPDPARLARADAELMRGCHACLIAARTAYRALVRDVDRSRLAPRLFEADLLIVLREKELGLPPSDALAEARVLAAQLPSVLEAPRYLAIVDAIPPSDLAIPVRELREFRVAHARALGPVRDQIVWLERGQLRSALRNYLGLALACAYPPDTDSKTGTAPRQIGVPLLDYRAAICDFGPIAALEAVRRQEPRFVETSLFIANTELAQAPREGPQRARTHIAEAAASFPNSTAVEYLDASHDLFVGEYEQALSKFERTLTARPDHDRAQLGRTICLDRLGRLEDVVASATQLLSLGEEHRADALFWRARGRLGLRQLAEARRDILAAKEAVTTSDVLSLSGRIAYELDDLDAARRDLTAAIGSAPMDCHARWYLAQVERRGKRWLDAGGAFRAAMTCFHDRAEDDLLQATRLRARSDLDLSYRTRVADNLAVAAEADRHERHRAALGGASCFVSGDDIASAKPLLEIAAEDPSLAASVAQLRSRLDPAQGRRPRGSKRSGGPEHAPDR